MTPTAIPTIITSIPNEINQSIDLIKIVTSPEVISIIIVPVIILLTQQFKKAFKFCAEYPYIVTLVLSLLFAIPYGLTEIKLTVIQSILLGLGISLSSNGLFSINETRKNK